AENEKSPASVNLQGFSVRLTISLNPTLGRASLEIWILGSFRLGLHHQLILLLGSFNQNLAVNTLLLVRFCIANKIGKGAFGPFSQT
ncbi:hypothetical protein PII47_22220, partial [Pseudomonas sp. 21TX0197]|uniref:hypothetical protein n=1 Tax=Pseudomonas sp. 21TX0197 TaxID=2972639 RepID=UPI00232EBC5A